MIVRLIILFLLFKFRKEIYKYLLEQNLLNLGGLADKISDGFTGAQKFLTQNKLKQKMLELKNLDKLAYREIKTRFLNIDKMYSNAVQEKDISLKNTYHNIKNEKKQIKNRISSITVKMGLHEGGKEMIQVFESHINDIIKNILDIRDRRGINTEWFEGTYYESVEAFDGQTNYNYDYYT
tara:strand:- start:453 stop:992 length:540 start_codon:yes stop_codon:yes gene_type:complete